MFQVKHDDDLCNFKFTYYENKNLALAQVNEIGNIENFITIDLENADLHNKYCAYINVNDDNPNILDWLEENGFGHPTHNLAHSLFNIYPEFEFNHKLVKANMTKEKTHA